MTTKSRLLVIALFGAVAVTVASLVLWRGAFKPSPDTSRASGGSILTTVRSDPRTFNPLLSRDTTSALLGLLTQASLVRINGETDEVEPWLAQSWSGTPDGMTYTLRLRTDAVFCDGVPLTAEDVVFSLQAIYDARVDSVLAEPLRVDDKPLHARATDAATVVLTFPAPYAPGLRLLHMFPVLPRHRLATALAAGTLRDAWGLGAPVTDMCGAGPFVIGEYVPGQRIVLQRNPHFWLRDENGVQLPSVDRIILEIVPDQNVEMLRLETGEVDFISSELRPEDYPAVKRAADLGRLRLMDLGVRLDADFLWFNLKPGGIAPDRAWLQRVELRHAISHAIDRQIFANAVFLGQGDAVHGPITPGNRRWFTPDLPRDEYDPARARQLLAEIGLEDHDRDGWLEDARRRRVAIPILVQKGHTLRERAVAVIQEDLRKIGLRVDVVPLEFGALVERITSGQYEAAYFGLRSTDTDPASNLDFWRSSGAFHFWNPAQPTPATEWERRFDELMLRQTTSLQFEERKKVFDEAQRLFAEQAPALYFAAPRLLLAVKPRVQNVRPSVVAPFILWNAERLSVSWGGGER